METNGQITYRDPADLKLHRLQKHLPEPDYETPQWHAFADSIRAQGILVPLIIDEANHVIDGGWRWRAAKRLQLDKIPCLTRPEPQAPLIIIDSLLQRKQMTRGAVIYLVLPLIEELLESAECRKLCNLKTGQLARSRPIPSNLESGGETIQELCVLWGVSDETFGQAIRVRKYFAGNPRLKTLYEPQLLDGRKNLWNVGSACGGDLSGRTRAGQAPKDFASPQLMLFEETLDQLSVRFKYWSGFDDRTKRAAISHLETKLATAPDDFLTDLRRTIDLEIKRRKDQV